MADCDKARGLKIRTKSDGTKVGYWVAAQCSRRASAYPDRTRRLVGPESSWADQCRNYTEDLKSWLAANAKKAPRKKGTMSSVENQMLIGKQSQTGFVYILRDKDQVKIGFSKNPRNRIATLQNNSGRALRVAACIPGTLEDEQRLHARFSTYRIHGEWFAAVGDLREFLRNPSRNLKEAIGK